MAKWNKELIIEEFNKIKDKGEPLNCGYLSENHTSLYKAIKRYYKQYQIFLNEIDIDIDIIYKEERWTPQKCIDEFNKIKNKEPLNSAYMQKNHVKLFQAISRCYPSYQFFIKNQGLDYNKICEESWKKHLEVKTIYTKEHIKNFILSRYDKNLPIDTVTIRKINASLYGASLKLYGGSWNNVLSDCGINPKGIILRRENYTKQEIQDIILKKLKNNEDVTSNYLQINEQSLYHAIYNFFGNLENLFKSLGIDYNEIRLTQKWTKTKIKKEALYYVKIGKFTESELKSINQPLYKAIYNNYGNFEKFCNDIGLNYEHYRKDVKEERYNGIKFEKIIETLFKINKINVIYHKNHKNLVPDFTGDNELFEVKLSSYTHSIEKDVENYIDLTDKLNFIYLIGNRRIYHNPKVKFIYVFDFFPNIPEDIKQKLIDLQQKKKSIF